MKSNWDIYPRPQMVRKDWLCLNGEWSFRTVGRDALGMRDNSEAAKDGQETINIPFCPESKLSGIGRRIDPGQTMIYEKEVTLPEEWKGRRILLHFGAVDQIAKVFINDRAAGEHEGGYLPFSFDITDLIYAKDEESEPPEEEKSIWAEDDEDEEPVSFVIRVEAVDELDHKYPWGKQKRNNGGMWYTPVSGIWQTVWLEPVNAEHIESLKIDSGEDWVEIRAYGIDSGVIELLGEKYRMDKEEGTDEKCASIHIDIHWPHTWSPEDPYLYNFTIETAFDKVGSYFALRTLTIEERGGYQRLCLNGEPYFFNGLLDQGYWKNGIYTPDDPQDFRRDIEAAKSLGFNTLRKHIKIEPEQFYYECDRLGMAVFQDMVNNADYSFVRDSVLPTIGMKKRGDRRLHTDAETRRIFLESMDKTVRTLYNHPCICYWTIFNEGWGQFDADEAYDRLKQLDDSRFIDSTSGWFSQNRSDVDSHHVYFKPIELEAGSKPLVLSEFGGYACKLQDHCYDPGKSYGYKKCSDEAALLWDIGKLYEKEVLPMEEKGLCAAIYTQLSDVEEETNGILTNDREVQKFKAYIGTGRIEIIGNHTDHQGGRVLVAPTPFKIRAYVADNHSDVIRIASEGFEPFEVSIGERDRYPKGTTQAMVAGLLDGFADLFGKFDISDRGFDAHVKSEVAVGSGLSSSAAFEILLARIINERYFEGKADAVQLAKIAAFSEREYYGKPCGMMDQLAISLGRLAMLDFSREEPEIELIDFDFDKAGLEIDIIPTESDHASLDAEYASVPDDMFAVAGALGIKRLADINEVQFRRKLPELEKKVEAGELTRLQLNRAKHFYDENERVLAGAIALKTGNVDRFLMCVNESGLSSENLLQNVLPPGVKETDLSRKLHEYRAKPDTAAIKLEGGGFGGSVLVLRRK